MSSKMLYEAIALVRAGKKDEARQIIFGIIRDEPENEMAWMWLAETLSSDQDRMKVLQACLKYNPNCKIANMAIEKLQEKIDQDAGEEKPETPFIMDEEVESEVPAKPGQTGALIGFDGSIILSEVDDFEDVIDLRTPAEETEPEEATEVDEDLPAVLRDEAAAGAAAADVPAAMAEEGAEEERYDPTVTPVPAEDEDIEPLELEFEPDLSELLAGEDIYSESEDKQSKSEEDDFDFSSILGQQPDVEEEELIDLDELSPAELGFIEDDSPDADIKLNEQIATNEELPEEEDLVEDRVVGSSVQKYSETRKKRERRTLFLVGGLFIVIAILCVTAVIVLGGYSRQAAMTAAEPTLTLFPTDTLEPTATATLAPTATHTPTATFTPTQIPTATPVVPLSENRISPDSVSALVLRLNQELPGNFYESLDGSLVAIANGAEIQVWDVISGRQLFNLQGHNAGISDIVFSPDERYLVSAARDFSVRLWNLQTGETEQTFTLDIGEVSRIFGDATRNYPRDVTVDYSPDGSTIAAGTFGLVSVLDIPTGLSRGSYALTDEELQAAAADVDTLQGFRVKFNENGWILSAAMSKNLIGLDTLDASPLYQYDLGPEAIIRYALDRVHMAEADLGGVAVRLMDTGEVINGFGGRQAEEPPLFGLSTDWETIAIESTDTGGQVQLSVWSIPADENVANFAAVCETADTCRAPLFALSPKGEFVAVEESDAEGNVFLRLVNLDSLQEIHRFSEIDGAVSSVSISPDGGLVAGLDTEGIIHLWDLEIGVERAAIQTNNLEEVLFSRNGQYLYAWNNDRLQVWSQPLPPPESAFPGVQAEEVENWLLAQNAAVNCVLGEASSENDWLVVNCQYETDAWTLTSQYSQDQQGYVYELRTSLAFAEGTELIEDAIDAIAYPAGLEYDGANPQAAQTWVSETLPTLAETTREETTIGMVWFELSRVEGGYQLLMRVPAASS